jgi:hypothetical protein
MDKYICIAHGPDQAKLEKTISFAAEEASKHDVHVLLIVPTFKNVSNTILANVIGEQAVNKLKKRQPVFLKMYNRIFIMESLQTAKNSYWKGVTLGLWGGEKMNKVLTKQNQSKAIVSITWNQEEEGLWEDFTNI